jgi:hypothetical protein
MPVIKVQPATEVSTLSPDVRESLLTELRNEIQGPGTMDGPIVFEISESQDMISVIVVWKRWKEVARSEDRSDIILDACKDNPQRIAQALGVTYDEALQEQLLPYAVVSQFEHDKFRFLVCNKDRAKANDLLDDIREAKRKQGGFLRPNGNVDLRFPTRAMAEQAEMALVQSHRDLNWRIVTDINDMP